MLVLLSEVAAEVGRRVVYLAKLLSSGWDSKLCVGDTSTFVS